MIIVDIETSGLCPHKHGLLSIGAVDYNSDAEFYGECCLAPGKEWSQLALDINGFTETDLFDKTKLSEFELFDRFCAWAADFEPLIGGQQVGSFDVRFLKVIHEKYSRMSWPFGYRTVDLHSVFYGRYEQSLSLDGILQHLGFAPEPKPHNALTGAKLEKAAFKKLLL